MKKKNNNRKQNVEQYTFHRWWEGGGLIPNPLGKK